jgi:hypothetical protein
MGLTFVLLISIIARADIISPPSPPVKVATTAIAAKIIQPPQTDKIRIKTISIDTVDEIIRVIYQIGTLDLENNFVISSQRELDFVDNADLNITEFTDLYKAAAFDIEAVKTAILAKLQ